MAAKNEYVYVRCEKHLTFQIKRPAGDLKPIRVPCPEDCPRKKMLLCWKRSFFTDMFSNIPKDTNNSADYIFDSTIANSVPRSLTNNIDSVETNCAGDYGTHEINDGLSQEETAVSCAEADIGYSFVSVESDDIFADTSLTRKEAMGSYGIGGQDKYRASTTYGAAETGYDLNRYDRPGTNEGGNQFNRSIFAKLKPLGDKPCFVDGVYMFFEKDVPYSAGDSRDAMDYIFFHWYTSAVFKSDEVTFKDEFLKLMELRGLDSREAEILEISENRNLSVNQKFFRLFYQIVNEGKMTEFYWHETESPSDIIIPQIASREDFYKQLLVNDNPKEYINKFSGCMDELIMFLTAGKPLHTDDPYLWFKHQITLRVAADEGMIAYIDGSGDSFELCRLGSIVDFVKDMSRFELSTSIRQKKMNFLREFRITPSYHVELREIPLEESKETDSSDDESVYKGAGITNAFSNVYATVYNEYVTVLKEYMNTFKPWRIQIGIPPYDITFTKKGFKAQLEGILWEAGQFLEDDSRTWHGHVEAVKYYMTRSLLIRGIFDEYLAQSEFKKMDDFVERFYRTNKLDRKMYFTLPPAKGELHMVTLDQETISIQMYFQRRLTGNPISDQEKMKKDSVINDYLEARKEDSAIERIIQEKKKRMDSAIEAYQKILRETEA